MRSTPGSASLNCFHRIVRPERREVTTVLFTSGCNLSDAPPLGGVDRRLRYQLPLPSNRFAGEHFRLLNNMRCVLRADRFSKTPIRQLQQ